MATNYPIALDTNTNLPNPTGASFQNNPDHGQQHANANDAIKALETKLGIGNTAPSATGLLLVPTGSGTTAWSQLTSSQLAATLTDETGTGNAVFNTTPTLVTPKIDTINENTTGNGVTAGGVNMKAGVITTANAVSANAIPQNGVSGDKLATSALFLGYAQTTTNFISRSTTAVQVPGLTITVTIPAGGRRVKLTAYCGSSYPSGAAARYHMTIWDGTVGTGTQLQDTGPAASAGNTPQAALAIAIVTPAAGSKTYNVGFRSENGTVDCVLENGTSSPAFILAELL